MVLMSFVDCSTASGVEGQEHIWVSKGDRPVRDAMNSLVKGVRGRLSFKQASHNERTELEQTFSQTVVFQSLRQRLSKVGFFWIHFFV